MPTEVEYKVLLSTTWDYVSSVAVTDGMILDEFGPNNVNPELKMYEDNTYIFEHMFFNRGKHPLYFKEVVESQQHTLSEL